MGDTNLFATLDSHEYEEELEKCGKAGGDVEEIKTYKLNLYQLMEVRRGLEAGVNVKRYLSSSMPWTLMEELRLEMEQGIDMSDYRKKGFSLPQVREIREGIKAGLDVAVYAKKEYFPEQMSEVRLGLMENLPVSLYLDNRFEGSQMAEIRKGLEANIDISVYANPGIPYLKMRALREALMAGIIFSKEQVRTYTAGMIEQIRLAHLDGIDLSSYVEQGYGAEQLEQIRLAIKDGVDLDPYITVELRGESIQEIRIGLLEGLDVGLYAGLEYNWQQMREIRKGLENRVDVTHYAKPIYIAQQMHEIRLGLQKGLDISVYSSVSNSGAQMKQIRKRLESGESISASQQPIGLNTDITKDLRYVFDASRVPVVESDSPDKEKKEHFLTVSEDQMECYLRLPWPAAGSSYSLGFLLSLLGRANIIKGVNKQVIQDMLQNNIYEKKVMVAQGQQPIFGQDGYYEFLIENNMVTEPELQLDGYADFSETKVFQEVKAGQKLAIYHKAVQGRDGYTVTGKELPGKTGRELPILKGHGFLYMEDGSYNAAVSGTAKLNGTELNIYPLTVENFVAQQDGKRFYSGSVWIKGNLEKGAEIQAEGDVLIDAFAEDATITAKGDIVIRRGSNGFGHGVLHAGGRIIGKYFQNLEMVSGGGIYTNSCLNCNIKTDGEIFCYGRDGTIYGGDTEAALGITVANLGSEQHIRTMVKIGVSDGLQVKYNELSRRIDRLEEEHAVFEKERLRLLDVIPTKQEELAWKVKINMATDAKAKEVANARDERNALEERIRKVSGATANVHNAVYAGTILMIDGGVMNITRTRHGKEMVFRGGES